MSDPENPNTDFVDEDGKVSADALAQLYAQAPQEPPQALSDAIGKQAQVLLQRSQANGDSNNAGWWHSKTMRWSGGLASAAIALLSITILYSGLITDTNLSVETETYSLSKEGVAERLDAQALATIQDPLNKTVDDHSESVGFSQLASTTEIATTDTPMAEYESAATGSAATIAPASPTRVRELAQQEAQKHAQQVAADIVSPMPAQPSPEQPEAAIQEQNEAALQHLDESELSMQRRAVKKQRRLMLANNMAAAPAVSSIGPCSEVREGFCQLGDDRFARSLNCAKDFPLPTQARHPRQASDTLIYQLDGNNLTVQCVDNVWRVTPLE